MTATWLRFALAVLIAVALAAPASPEARQTVTLVMTDYRFVPAKLTFRAGRSYRLVLVNRGRELHEFTAPVFLGAVALDNPDLLVADGREIAIPPGANRELLFRTTRRGRYPLICADHDWAGMVGEIVVE